MAAAYANATLLLCAWWAEELLLFSAMIFSLSKMQHILQNKGLHGFSITTPNLASSCHKMEYPDVN